MSEIKNLAKVFLGVAVLVVGVYTFDPLFGGDPLTYEEYRSYIEMVDYEAKMVGGLVVENLDDQENLPQRINDAIEKRKITEKEVDLNGEKLTGEEYAALRAGLIQKADNLEGL